jgi:hypothetical protein
VKSRPPFGARILALKDAVMIRGYKASLEEQRESIRTGARPNPGAPFLIMPMKFIAGVRVGYRFGARARP